MNQGLGRGASGGKNASQASMTTWVWIPRTHVKGHVWRYMPVASATKEKRPVDHQSSQNVKFQIQ